MDGSANHRAHETAVVAETIAKVSSIRSIQDLLRIAQTASASAHAKLDARREAKMPIPAELVKPLEEVCDAVTHAKRSLQTPRAKLRLSETRLEEILRELRQLARVCSRPETDHRNYQNALIVMAALALHAGYHVTIDREAGREDRTFLILHLPTGQISFSANGGGVERLEETMGLHPGTERTWDGHTTQERTLRVEALAASTRITERLPDLPEGEEPQPPALPARALEAEPPKQVGKEASEQKTTNGRSTSRQSRTLVTPVLTPAMA